MTGHYVNYRKQLAETDQPPLPETSFRLYAVCSRFPHNLAQAVPWQRLQAGVYECRRGTDVIRVVVAGQLPRTEHNALLHLFSAAPQQLRYGMEHFRQHSPDTSTFIQELLQSYRQEGLAMPYTVEDFRREYAKKYFKDLTQEEQLDAMRTLAPKQLEQMEQAVQQLKAEKGPKPRKSSHAASRRPVERSNKGIGAASA